MIKLTPTHIRNRFYDSLAEMEKNRRLYVKHPEKDFTRSGTFTFQQTMLFITQMQSHSTSQELNTFFIPKNKRQGTVPCLSLIFQAKTGNRPLSFGVTIAGNRTLR